ncbi:MAG: Gfo/Idh/MocA family oxidoreductase [Verrucomicrobia bacterium]|nr:Gfo/Idh/MocA family oxidoreductase [Verrucomicrobiota bacterium]
MEKIRYAVIGTGGIAQHHLRDFTSKPGVEVVGLSDSMETNLKKTAEKFPKAVACVDPRRMLAEARPDLVSICTPNKFHCEYTLAALKQGAHVACEKPMAMTVAEAEKMEAARRKAGKLGLVNFSYRSVHSFRFARELIQNGEIGKLLRVHAVYLQSFLGAEGTRYSWRNNIKTAGFGALGDLGIHMIDAARFITRLEIKRVIGLAQTLIPSKPDSNGRMQKVTTDTNASFLACFQNGMIGTFEATQVAPGYGNFFRIEISGERGTLSVLSEKNTEIQLFAGKTLSHHATWQTSAPLHSVPTDFISAQPPSTPGILVDVLRGSKAVFPTFKDGLVAQRVLAGIIQSMKTNSWVLTD